MAKALQMANGLVLVGTANGKSSCIRRRWRARIAGWTCPSWSRAASSFNWTFGACPECHGLGSMYDLDPAKVITDWSKPLLDGGLGPGSASQYLLRLIHLAAERYKIDLKKPFEQLPQKQQDILLYGPPKGEAPRTGFHGILAYLRDSLEESRSRGVSRVDDELHVGDAVPGVQGASGCGRSRWR